MITTAQRNNVVDIFPQQQPRPEPARPHIQPVRDLYIEGVDRPEVTEIRHVNVLQQQQHGSKPASARNLAQRTRKKPEAGFRLMETADATLGMVMAAKTVRAGLKQGETIVLVAPDKPELIVRKLSMTGFDADAAVATGKLIIFSSQPAIGGNLSLSTNYRKVFGELFELANAPIDRIVIMGMDMLVNLESQYLAFASVSKFTQAADEMGIRVLAQYTRNQSAAHDRLDAACSSLVNAYYVMNRSDSGARYSLSAKNVAV